MSRLTEQLASLTPAQRALLERKLGQRRSAEPRIPRRSDLSKAVLSLGQQRLWFVEQLQGSSAFHISAAVRIEGPLEVDGLAAAVSGIVARHEVLRTSCRDDGGTPVAVLADAVPVTLDIVDLEHLPADRRLDEAARLTADVVAMPIDPAGAVLVRASLLRMAAQDHVLVLVVHHIAADAWSMGVLCRELAALYSAHRDGAAAPLSPLPIQYADFAAWQKELLEGPRARPQIDWWREQLQGAPLLELPFDRPRRAIASPRGGRERRHLAAERLSALQRFSSGRGVTLFTTLLAAYALLLRRWSGQPDVVVGTPVAGRQWPEVEPLIGLFINTLALRCDLSGNPTFTELLERVRTTVGGALEHQDVPFERLVDELGVARTLSHAPLTSVVFSLQNVPPVMLSLDGVRTTPFDYHRGTTRFDLSVLATESADGLHLSAEYSADLFDAATVQRLLDGFECVLDAVVATPELRVRDVPILPAAEAVRIVTEFNRTARPLPHQRTVVDLIVEHAAARPDAPAIVAGADALTYGELLARARGVARRLRATGTGPEQVVGVLCERGAGFVVAALGVLLAGGAYAPFDPRTPPARLGQMLGRAGIKVLLVSDGQPAIAPGVAQVRLDELTGDGERSEAAPAIDLEQLAYVVHTSGSTGEPNGVGITHRSLLNLVHWHQRTYGMTASDVTAQVANVGFDACVWELWPSLAAGAAVHIPDASTRDVPQRFWQWIAESRITTMFMPTPLAEACLQHPVPAGISLRALLTGGDRLHPIPEGLPFDVVNHYGPTESTVVATAGVVSPGGDAAPSIGTPIDNTTVVVLDDRDQVMPIGVVGELSIGGGGLARGYVGNPRLTAERFVPDGVSGVSGARRYRTGDLVRFGPDGAIEFQGRRDHQVKIRGYRIELAEIEGALARHPGVAAAAVTAVSDPIRGATLAAYVVAANGASPSDEDVRVFLKESLPAYMVPAVFVRMAALPLSHNGKVDRAALPAPVFTASGDTWLGPRNEAEEIVAQVCGELLRVERVGMGDDFFDLGGHSLLATQLAFRLGQAFEIDVPLRLIFEHPTLAELADAIVGRLLADEPAE